MTLARLAPPTYQGDQRPMPGTPINWDSRHAGALAYCWPLWEGGGSRADELVRGSHAIVNTPGSGVWRWETSSIGAGFVRIGINDIVLLAGTSASALPVLRLPVTLTCALKTVAGGVVHKFLNHDGPGNNGYCLDISSTNLLRFTLNAVANYTSTITITPGQLYYVAASATGNGGTVRWAAYNTVTQQLSVDGPTTIGTMSGTPKVWSLGGLSWAANGADDLFIADARAYARSMGIEELVDLVTPSSRWNLYATGTFTRGSVQATVTMDAPPMVFLELDDLPMGNIQLGLPAPPLAILELDTPPLAAQAIQPFGGIHGAIASAGLYRGAIAAD